MDCKVRILPLTSSKDFTVHLYVCEGSAFNIIKRKEEVKVPRANRIEETEDSIMFFHFDSLVGMFSKANVICYVADS